MSEWESYERMALTWKHAYHTCLWVYLWLLFSLCEYCVVSARYHFHRNVFKTWYKMFLSTSMMKLNGVNCFSKNPFSSRCSLLIPQKTSENLWFSGGSKENIGNNRDKLNCKFFDRVLNTPVTDLWVIFVSQINTAFFRFYVPYSWQTIGLGKKSLFHLFQNKLIDFWTNLKRWFALTPT